MTPKIAGAGISCIDYILIGAHVDWGNTVNVSNYCAQGGGLVATGLVACARLGADCAIYSLLGDDDIGDRIVNELIDERVNTSGVVRATGGRSPFSFIYVDEQTGERTIFHRPGGGLTYSEDSLDLSAIKAAGALLVDDYYCDLGLAAAKVARSNGVPVVADLIPDDKNAEMLREVDILIAPRHYARQIGCEDDLDSALDRIHELGPTTAVITLGADGWVYSDPTGRGRGDAFKVDVVDTTGAGDTFHGAYTYGVASGWNTPKSAEFASAVAAIKCTKEGGRTGLPSLAQTAEFLSRRSGNDWSDL